MNFYKPASAIPSETVYFFVRPVTPPEFLIIRMRGGQMLYAATTNLAEATTFTNVADLQKQQQAMQVNKPEALQQGFQGTQLTYAEFLQRTGNQQPRPL